MKLLILALAFTTAGVAALTCADDASCDGCLTQPTSGGPTTCETTWGPRKCERKNQLVQTVDKVYCPEDLCLVKPLCTGCVAEKSNHGGILCRNDWNEAKCTRKKSNPKYRDTNWCGSMPIPDTTAEKTECLAATGAWHGLQANFCQTCCPACEASADWDFEPSTGACACIDYSGDGQYITLTSKKDCARITGDGNFVLGDPLGSFPPVGDNDAMFANGVGNFLQGAAGDDHLVMKGSGGHIWGGYGDNDVCTDLGANQFYNEVYQNIDYGRCETCFGPASEVLNCATGDPVRA